MHYESNNVTLLSDLPVCLPTYLPILPEKSTLRLFWSEWSFRLGKQLKLEARHDDTKNQLPNRLLVGKVMS